MSKSDNIYLKHILDSVKLILSYTDGVSEEGFYSDQQKMDAVIRNFEIIGEAAKRGSAELKSQHPRIEWKNMAGMRDKLIHDYIEVDYSIVWATIELYLPQLKKDISELIVD